MAALRTYDVLLSFRGKETHTGFTSHLYKALRQKQINVYVDHRHERAEPIDTILRKIEDAALSCIVFFPGFADSDSCLDEVVKIVECHQRNGQKIFPVFYRVSTDAVQDKAGSFANTITALEKSAKDEDDVVMLKKVPNWRKALSVAASQTGLMSTNFSDDAEFVKKIVANISEKLVVMSPGSVAKNLVGMGSQIKKIKEGLHFGASDTRIVCLWGIASYGKTTSAREAFRQLSPVFERNYFLENVTNSTESLKLKLYSGLLPDENYKSYMDIEKELTRSRLKCTIVFVVLDDVDNALVLNDLLLGGRDTFAAGSKIIVTSRNNVFGKIADVTEEVKELSDENSIQLFSLYAFPDGKAAEGRHFQILEVVRHSQNNPLALKVLGTSMLSKGDDENWKSLLHGLRDMKFNGFGEVFKILKRSCNELSEDEKNIFLDIVCFFRGEDRNYVTKVLDVCYGRCAFIKTTTLIERALVIVSDNKKLDMHELIQEMGQNIVEGEPPSNPKKGTRLWKPEVIKKVFRRNRRQGIDKIEGMCLDLSKTGEKCIEPDAFEDMDNLRLLKFYVPDFSMEDCMKKVSFRDGLHSLPEELHYFYWYGFPLESLPSSFTAEKLVELNLPYSRITKLWTANLYLPELKRIDSRHSKLLTEVPDLSKAEHIERINLEGCEGLKQLHASIQDLTQLEYLNLSRCSSLESLPHKLVSKELRILDISHCTKVAICPEVAGQLLVLNLSWTAIEELPRSFSGMDTLVLVDLRGCSNIFEDAKKLEKSLMDNDLRFYRDLLDWRW